MERNWREKKNLANDNRILKGNGLDNFLKYSQHSGWIMTYVFLERNSEFHVHVVYEASLIRTYAIIILHKRQQWDAKTRYILVQGIIYGPSCSRYILRIVVSCFVTRPFLRNNSAILPPQDRTNVLIPCNIAFRHPHDKCNFPSVGCNRETCFFFLIKLKTVVASLFAITVSVVVIIRKDFITVFKVDGLRQMEVRSMILSL